MHFSKSYKYVAGSHNEERITGGDTSSERKRLRCYVCKAKTSFKCGKCSRPGKIVAFCRPSSGKTCWNDVHGLREYDIQSSQSAVESSQER